MHRHNMYDTFLDSQSVHVVKMTKETKLGAAAALNGDELFGQLARDDDAAVLAVRNLVFDLCTQNGGGHGGSALGMAAIGVALWKYTMRYNPADPEWFDRDRFVLSNGNGRSNITQIVQQERADSVVNRTCEHVPLCHELPGGIRCLDNR